MGEIFSEGSPPPDCLNRNDRDGERIPTPFWTRKHEGKHNQNRFLFHSFFLCSFLERAFANHYEAVPIRPAVKVRHEFLL